ncbi:MAG: hypothetical protein SFW63_04175 [Alphaproteobacteria bacterium]|nr:hypothetical protein [Alphaproteobacteria bacterium]
MEEFSTPSGAVVKNYRANDSLAVTHDLDCIPLSSVQSRFTPPDLYNAFAKCIKQGSYEDAMGLFMLAGGYVRFDIQRVADRTAHQARTVLLIKYGSDLAPSEKNGWNAYADEFSSNSTKRERVCETIKKIGAPSYYPMYMIQHGINAFSKDKAEPLVKDFDEKKVWEKVLEENLLCKVNSHR